MKPSLRLRALASRNTFRCSSISLHASDCLRSLQVQGTIGKAVPAVLFVCVQNAGRSQMAAGLLEKLASGRVHVRSAGSTPADEINPAAVQAMAEIGVDLSQDLP